MNDADLQAAWLLLARMGITPEQLLRTEHTANTYMPTFGEYIGQVADAVPAGTRRAYRT
jgi:integrase/recombinase XerC